MAKKEPKFKRKIIKEPVKRKKPTKDEAHLVAEGIGLPDKPTLKQKQKYLDSKRKDKAQGKKTEPYIKREHADLLGDAGNYIYQARLESKRASFRARKGGNSVTSKSYGNAKKGK